MSATDGEPPRESEAPARRPFAAWLQEQRAGGLHAELSEQLTELVTAVIEHEKTGKLTLVIKVEPNGDGSVFVSDEIKTQIPQPDRPRSLFYADARGNLSRRDPRQPELPLREVLREQAEPREIERRAS